MKGKRKATRPPTQTAWPKSSGLHILAVFLLTCVVYANSLRNDFNFDDVTIIRDNPSIRSLANLPHLFASNYWAGTGFENGVLLYRPLAMASFAVDYAFWQANPLGFHLTNLLLNGIVAALLWVLLARLFGDRLGPLPVSLCTLLFALHPVHTEAVDMVVGRTELLAALFGLLTFIFYLKRWNAAAFAAFFLALLSKESAVMIPAVIFLYEWLFRRGLKAGRYVIFGGVLALYLVIRFAVLGGLVAHNQTGILSGLDHAARAFTVIKVLGYYLKLLFVPYPLTPDYSDVPLAHSLLELWVFAPAVILGALLVVAWKTRRTHAAAAYAILWFLATILPVSNIVSIGAFLGERFLYLPSLALTLGAAALLCRFAAPEWRNRLLAGLTVLALLEAAATCSRNFAWKNADTLWADVIVHQPDNPRANFNMGRKFERETNYPDALPYYEKSVAVYPDHNWNPDKRSVAAVKQTMSRLYCSLAIQDFQKQDFPASLDHCRKALDNDAKNADAWVVLGGICVKTSDVTNAVAAFETALQIAPDNVEARENLNRIKEYSQRTNPSGFPHPASP